MSTSVPLGETALFMCAGEGILLFWTINGQPYDGPANKERGVKVMYNNTNPPVWKLNLTIPGTMENDNVSIQCVLFHPSEVYYSPAVYLTVLGKLCIVKVAGAPR